MLFALVAFMAIATPWLAFAAAGAILIAGGLISRALWNKFTDSEGRRRELEDRVRNWFP
jgi:hypothetical protein